MQRVTAIENSLHKEVVQIAECRSDRFLPYIQPYEFEALLFSDTSKLAHERPGWARWDEELAAARRGAASPEHINDGPDTFRRRAWSDLPATMRFAMVRPVPGASGWAASGRSAVTLLHG